MSRRRFNYSQTFMTFGLYIYIYIYIYIGLFCFFALFVKHSLFLFLLGFLFFFHFFRFLHFNLSFPFTAYISLNIFSFLRYFSIFFLLPFSSVHVSLSISVISFSFSSNETGKPHKRRWYSIVWHRPSSAWSWLTQRDESARMAASCYSPLISWSVFFIPPLDFNIINWDWKQQQKIKNTLIVLILWSSIFLIACSLKARHPRLSYIFFIA